MGHLCPANLLLSWLGHMCIWRDCVAPLDATVWDLNFSDKLKQFLPEFTSVEVWVTDGKVGQGHYCLGGAPGIQQRILGFMRLFLNPKPDIDILIIGNILPSWPAPISFKWASLAWRMGGGTPSAPREHHWTQTRRAVPIATATSPFTIITKPSFYLVPLSLNLSKNSLCIDRKLSARYQTFQRIPRKHGFQEKINLLK